MGRLERTDARALEAGGEVRRLRIAMVLDEYEARTGAVISTRRFAELLGRLGHEVTVIAAGPDGPNRVGMRELHPPFAGRVMRKMRVSLAWPDAKKLTAALRGQDVVHLQFPFWLSASAARIANELGVPVVSTFHVQAEHVLYNIGLRSEWLVRWLSRRLVKSIYQRSSHVICPSQFAERELRRHGLTRPATVISNGVSPEYRPLPRAGLPAFDGKLMLLSVGRLAREKRHGLLIEAVRRSRHAARIQLVIIGDGPLREDLQRRGRALANPPRFLYLPPEELPRWYNAADLYVHAADVEVECMTVLEAMGCGLPCLIARSPKSATQQFALGDEWLYRWDSRDELTARLDALLDDPAKLQAARAASAQAAKRYRIDESLAKLLSVYQEVTTLRHSRS